MSLVLIPTLNGNLHNRSPQQQTVQKNQNGCLHPLASRPPPASSPHVAPALFVWLSVCLFLWLVVASSLCPLLSRPIPSRRRATSFHYVSSLVVRLVVVESSRHRVSSPLVDVSRPLTHLVSPASFDCCVVVLHLAVTVQPQPPLPSP
jgi:hypothetical protein